MPGDIQKHTLVYTVVVAIFLTIFFDLSRIASLGAIFYILMDIIIHWGLLRHMREEINVNPYIVSTAIILDVVVLGALLMTKASTDMFLVAISVILIVLIFIGEKWFIGSRSSLE